MSIFNPLGNDTNQSPGSLGSKIKRIRELRGLTQKELGIRCGFSASTADVRIAQYEKNKKIPREKALRELAAALEVPEGVLDPDPVKRDDMYHVLFDIEDYHGLHPVQIGERFFLEFSGPTVWGTTVHSTDYASFLRKWMEMYQKYAPTSGDSPQQTEEKANAYTAWRLGYPLNEAKENSAHFSNMMKMHRLQAEMDITYAEMMSDEEYARIFTAIEKDLADAKSKSTSITKESEFIYLIKEMIEAGIQPERFSPVETPSYDYLHLVSFKSETLTSSDTHTALYARFVCLIELLQKKGFDIRQSITSKNKELFVTYQVAVSQSEYFANLGTYWDDMMFIIERREPWPAFELEPYEVKFADHISGDNDMILEL